jgi:hypothetical protein
MLECRSLFSRFVSHSVLCKSCQHIAPTLTSNDRRGRQREQAEKNRKGKESRQCSRLSPYLNRAGKEGQRNARDRAEHRARDMQVKGRGKVCMHE